MELSIANYLEIIERNGILPGISIKYREAMNLYCNQEQIKLKRLFSRLPGTDIYSLSGVMAILISSGDVLNASEDKLKYEIGSYIDGFVIGHDSLFVKPSITGINTEYIYKQIKDFAPLLNPWTQNDNGEWSKRNWYDYGHRIGRYYAAWCMVLENQSLFEPLFKATSQPQPPVKRRDNTKYWGLYYSIKNNLQSSNLWEGLGKENWCKKIASETEGIDSWKNFQIHFNKFSNTDYKHLGSCFKENSPIKIYPEDIQLFKEVLNEFHQLPDIAQYLQKCIDLHSF